METKELKTSDDLTELFLELNEGIFNFILFRVGKNRETAEDLSQNVFLKAWENRDKYDHKKGALKTWIYTIAKNTIIDFYRTNKASRNSSFTDQVLVGEKLDLDASLMSDYVLDKLSQLTDEEQNLIILKYIEQLNTKEIAKIINKKIIATKVAIHRSLKKLTKIINEDK